MSEYPEKIIAFSDRVKAWQSGLPVVPVGIDIELTYVCNHACRWCSYSSLLRPSGPRLPLALVVHCLDWAKENHVGSILYSGGGEPTLHPDFRAIMDATQQRSLDFAIFTNGSTLLHLAKAIPESCRYIRISLDAGTQATHKALHGAKANSLAEIGRALQLIRAQVPQTLLGLSYVVTEDNCREAAEAYELAKRWGIDQLFFKREVSLERLPNGFDIEWVDRLNDAGPSVFVRNSTAFRGHKTKVCHTSPLKAVVDPEGKLYICCARRSSDDMIGDLRENSFSEIWCSKRHRSVWSALNLSECRDCRMRQYNEIVDTHLKHETLAQFI